eukprot:GILK01000151.1.p1 GENE.GILK01000151.1~~GILK01000151.1.p1  ORF type:complete len:584 (-),score=137.28 GILK01000151.1:112-1791(-)
MAQVFSARALRVSILLLLLVNSAFAAQKSQVRRAHSKSRGEGDGDVDSLLRDAVADTKIDTVKKIEEILGCDGTSKDPATATLKIVQVVPLAETIKTFEEDNRALTKEFEQAFSDLSRQSLNLSREIREQREKPEDRPQPDLQDFESIPKQVEALGVHVANLKEHVNRLAESNADIKALDGLSETLANNIEIAEERLANSTVNLQTHSHDLLLRCKSAYQKIRGLETAFAKLKTSVSIAARPSIALLQHKIVEKIDAVSALVDDKKAKIDTAKKAARELQEVTQHTPLVDIKAKLEPELKAVQGAIQNSIGQVKVMIDAVSQLRHWSRTLGTSSDRMHHLVDHNIEDFKSILLTMKRNYNEYYDLQKAFLEKNDEVVFKAFAEEVTKFEKSTDADSEADYQEHKKKCEEATNFMRKTLETAPQSSDLEDGNQKLHTSSSELLGLSSSSANNAAHLSQDTTLDSLINQPSSAEIAAVTFDVNAPMDFTAPLRTLEQINAEMHLTTDSSVSVPSAEPTAVAVGDAAATQPAADVSHIVSEAELHDELGINKAMNTDASTSK